jgi:hypothetical protein
VGGDPCWGKLGSVALVLDEEFELAVDGALAEYGIDIDGLGGGHAVDAVEGVGLQVPETVIVESFVGIG